MFFLAQLSAIAGPLVTRDLYRRLSAWLISMALRAGTGRYRLQPTITAPPAVILDDQDDDPLAAHAPHRPFEELYCAVEESSYAAENAVYQTTNEPSYHVEMPGVAQANDSTTIPASHSTDLVWVGNAPRINTSPMSDLLPIIALLLLSGLLIGALIEIVTAVKCIKLSSSRTLQLSPHMREGLSIALSFIEILCLPIIPVHKLIHDVFMMPLFHVLCVIFDDDRLVSLHDSFRVVHQPYTTIVEAFSSILHSELLVVRITLRNSTLHFALPACRCYIVEELRMQHAEQAVTVGQPSVVVPSGTISPIARVDRGVSTMTVYTRDDLRSAPAEITIQQATVVRSYTDQTVSVLPVLNALVKKDVVNASAQTNDDEALCAACQRVISHVRAVGSDESSSDSGDSSADTVIQAVYQPLSVMSEHAARRSCVPAEEGLPRNLIADCADDELVFTDIAELRVYRAGFEAASDAAAHVPPTHNNVPFVPRRFSRTQRDRDVYCFGYWEFQHLRELNDLEHPLSADYYLGMMAKEKDVVMMPGTRPYQETRACRLGWCDEWYLTSHPMRNGQRSCRSWT
ncbi:hypothetical protein BD626DRAFT_255425 [Schizophyllum amplum]|uniref:Uncharacterized protein n=1 Tax=Schizophyllum amplum TaxID=97359 RepID=A0A550CIH7_9AGAR|nr:hypothetical protein BD626DRAFT_255425 [Auriculariopsis ampla]